ncbi:MAG: hypothetical protein AB1634_12875 [Thermodesulfobacteriota bacterium]
MFDREAEILDQLGIDLLLGDAQGRLLALATKHDLPELRDAGLELIEDGLQALPGVVRGDQQVMAPFPIPPPGVKGIPQGHPFRGPIRVIEYYRRPETPQVLPVRKSAALGG